jgi:hypothetical protein
MPIEWHRLKYSKGTPRVVAKLWADRLAQVVEEECRARVNRRDGYRCFFPQCKRRVSDRHHVRPRSLGGRWISRNILSSCRLHHDWFKAQLIRISGNPDRKTVRVHLTPLGKEAGIRVPSRIAA